MIDPQYWREFAIKFARKRGVSNPDTLDDIAQDALAKIYGLDLDKLETQRDVERFVGRCVANMIRDWQRREEPRTHAQLFDFTHHLYTTSNIENIFIDYVDSTIPRTISFFDGREALVDSQDYPTVEQFNWHVKNCGAASYARAWSGGTHVYLHRLIAQQVVRRIPSQATVNFVSSNTLDCRRANLRIGDCALMDLV